MVSSIFIHRDRLLSYSAIGSTTKARMRCKLLTEWRPGFFFFAGEEMNPTALSGATLKFELKNKATGAALLYTTTFSIADDGHHADFASVDSDGLRTLIGDQVSVIVTGEIEWTIAGRTRRATVDVLVENAFVRPGDAAPDPVAEASEIWLGERAVCFDREQDLSEEEQQQARENIGAGDGFSGSYNDLTNKPTLGTAAARDVGAAAGTVCAGNDARLTDARTPTGAAGGVLTGTYPNPSFAEDMATQAELDDLANQTASISHTHGQGDVTGLVTALAGKAATSHTHAQSEVTGLVTALAGKASTSHTHAQSEVTNLASDLAAKVPTSRQVATANSLTGGGDLSANRTLSLVNDTTPSAYQLYGTNGSATRGWIAALRPASGTVSGHDIPGTPGTSPPDIVLTVTGDGIVEITTDTGVTVITLATTDPADGSTWADSSLATTSEEYAAALHAVTTGSLTGNEITISRGGTGSTVFHSVTNSSGSISGTGGGSGVDAIPPSGAIVSDEVTGSGPFRIVSGIWHCPEGMAVTVQLRDTINDAIVWSVSSPTTGQGGIMTPATGQAAAWLELGPCTLEIIGTTPEGGAVAVNLLLL